MLARRFGGTRAGELLDPIADKLFAAVAFVTVARDTVLHSLEVLGVLLRDIIAVLAFLEKWLQARPVALPARVGWQWLKVRKLMTLVACIGESSLARPA